MTTRFPAPDLRHLATLTDETGIVEHARLNVPRPALGYCTDDAGRALAIACLLATDPDARRIAEASITFLERAHAEDGVTFALRRFPDRAWSVDRSDDASARALFGLGTAAALAPWGDVRNRARRLFTTTAGFRSPHPRATAYAVLGASRLLDAFPGDGAARAIVTDGARTLPRPATDPAWPWPAPTLTYANATVPDALLAAGAHLREQPLVEQGLRLLSWLAAEETHQDHFSFAPVGGRGPGGCKPAFDQQPIEAAAMTAACARAFSLTGDAHWHVLVDRAAAWFCGRNDTSALLYDAATGGCRDGLERTGPNLNEGAESTIAFLDAMTSARRLAQLTKEAS